MTMAGFLDKAKDLARDMTGKAKTTFTENAERIDGGIDKAADFVDEKTKGKYTDRIGKAQDAAHRAVDKFGREGQGGEGGAPGGEGGAPGAPGEGGTPGTPGGETGASGSTPAS
jgi:hypothetical protein